MASKPGLIGTPHIQPKYKTDMGHTHVCLSRQTDQGVPGGIARQLGGSTDVSSGEGVKAVWHRSGSPSVAKSSYLSRPTFSNHSPSTSFLFALPARAYPGVHQG